jgi:hypothetical protein
MFLTRVNRESHSSNSGYLYVLNTIVQKIENISEYNFDKVEQFSARKKIKKRKLARSIWNAENRSRRRE